MPIANVELVMMASVAILAAQHFLRKVNNWEGLPSTSCTWMAWKTAFCLAHVKRQQQILALGGGEPLGGAHSVIPAAAPAIGRLKTALDNLALAAMNNTAVLRQLIAANLALTATITLFTSSGRYSGSNSGSGLDSGSNSGGNSGGDSSGYSCKEETLPRELLLDSWPRVSEHHTSATYANKAPGHRDNAMASKTFGGSNKDKNWNAACT